MMRYTRSRRAVAGLLAAGVLFAAAAGPATATPTKPWRGNGGKSAAAQADHKPAGTGSGRKIG